MNNLSTEMSEHLSFMNSNSSGEAVFGDQVLYFEGFHQSRWTELEQKIETGEYTDITDFENHFLTKWGVNFDPVITTGWTNGTDHNSDTTFYAVYPIKRAAPVETPTTEAPKEPEA